MNTNSASLAPRQTIDGQTKKFASDPVDAMLEQEARRDHAQAARRGENARFIADRVLTELQAKGVTIDPATLRPLFVNAVIDALYPGVAVDLPRMQP